MLSIVNAHIRLLLPFQFPSAENVRAIGPRGLDAVRDRLLAHDATAIGRSGPIWKRGQLSTSDLYLRDQLGAVVRAVFPEGAERPQSRYFVVDREVSQALLQPQALEILRWRGSPSEKKVLLRGLPAEDTPIELFLSEFGFGVLSLNFVYEPEAGLVPNAAYWPADHACLIEFIHEACQLGAARGALLRQKPKHGVEPPPAPPAPLVERLGRRGGEYALTELISWLLPFDWLPCGGRRSGDELVAGRLTAYTVVRGRALNAAGQHLGLDDADVRRDCGRLLAALAQVQPVSHRGMPGRRLGIANALLTRQHWAAAGSIGAAHMILDQGESQYDVERPLRALRQYFSGYLLALHQRWHAQATLCYAQARVESLLNAKTRRGRSREERELQLQRERLLDFSVSADFALVGNVENVNRWYQVARAGLRSAEGMAGVRRGLSQITGIMSQSRAEMLQRELVAAQHKIEWVEVLIVTIYFVELVHILAEHSGLHGVIGLGFVLVGTVGGFAGALTVIRPWARLEEEDDAEWPDVKPRAWWRHDLLRRLSLVLMLVLITWFAALLVNARLGRMSPDRHTPTLQDQTSSSNIPSHN